MWIEWPVIWPVALKCVRNAADLQNLRRNNRFAQETKIKCQPQNMQVAWHLNFPRTGVSFGHNPCAAIQAGCKFIVWVGSRLSEDCPTLGEGYIHQDTPSAPHIKSKHAPPNLQSCPVARPTDIRWCQGPFTYSLLFFIYHYPYYQY